ncbi:MAG: hypothetical protein KGL39_59640 [Patescibacteria group bacterium]|nr:hypothetical protein [Patescibacteria group bacterium]
MSECPHCRRQFEQKRPDQVYCKPACRIAHYERVRGDGALRAAVSAVRVLKGGGVSAVLRFQPSDRDNALQLTPGATIEVLR